MAIRRVTNSGVADTSPEMENVLLDAYRRMDGREKLRRAASLRLSIEHLARTRIRAQYGEELTEREMQFRLAALRLGPRLMIEAFGWDPRDHGYWSLDDILAVTLLVTETLERLEVPYVVGGSLASSFHGIPRATIDADLVAALRSGDVPGFVGALETSFYLDADAVRSAVEDRTSFNVIHLETMFKVDVFVAGNDRATELELERGRAFVVADEPERSLRISTPEDTIAQKLYWYALGDGVSDRQWSDAMGVLRVAGPALDLSYLRHVASLLQVPELLEKALFEAGLSGPR